MRRSTTETSRWQGRCCCGRIKGPSPPLVQLSALATGRSLYLWTMCLLTCGRSCYVLMAGGVGDSQGALQGHENIGNKIFLEPSFIGPVGGLTKAVLYNTTLMSRLELQQERFPCGPFPSKVSVIHRCTALYVHYAEAAIQRVESAPAVARSNSYKSLPAILLRLHIAAKTRLLLSVTCTPLQKHVG